MTPKIAPTKIAPTLITLGVADVSRATRFYEEMGLRRSSAGNDAVTFFQAGGVVLALFGRSALAQDAGVAEEGEGFRALSLAWNVGSETEVDEAYARLVAAGATPVKTPQKTFWGGYAAYVSDPDGHLWEIAHNPFFPFDPEGRLVLPD